MITLNFLEEFDFFCGVPDSQLRLLCDYLDNKYNSSKNHIVAANEGNAVAIAAGYHLATNRVPVVYMQNSGEGNAVNPITSLVNEKVYNIPIFFIIGWRGEPGVHDEPQHAFQGEITLELLDVLKIPYFVVSKETTDKELAETLNIFGKNLKDGKQVALIIKKGAIQSNIKVEYKNNAEIKREDAIAEIVKYADDDAIISTTGKASRELFEIREKIDKNHSRDFLTVGSMGHTAAIGLGIALNTNKRVWVIDGDGSLLMHMGVLPIIANISPKNFVHIVINNGAHETVGGMKLNSNCSFADIALSAGYKNTKKVKTLSELKDALAEIKNKNELTLLEIFCSIGSRVDLGRPTIAPEKNKLNFMEFLRQFN